MAQIVDIIDSGRSKKYAKELMQKEERNKLIRAGVKLPFKPKDKKKDKKGKKGKKKTKKEKEKEVTEKRRANMMKSTMSGKTKKSGVMDDKEYERKRKLKLKDKAKAKMQKIKKKKKIENSDDSSS